MPASAAVASQASATCLARWRMRAMVAVRSVTEITPRACRCRAPGRGLYRPVPGPALPQPLPARAGVEEEVLALMVRGLKDRQIAEAMGLSYETVRNYVLGTLKEASPSGGQACRSWKN
jgi:DNA-binding NarL/FixJ family response regulator